MKTLVTLFLVLFTYLGFSQMYVNKTSKDLIMYNHQFKNIDFKVLSDNLVKYRVFGIGNEPNIPNALVTEAMAACMGATAAPAPGTAPNKPNTVFKVAKTGVSNVIITIGDIVVSF